MTNTKWNSITVIPGSLRGKKTCNGALGSRITKRARRSPKQLRTIKSTNPARHTKSGLATAIQDGRRRNSLRVGRPQQFAVVAQTAGCQPKENLPLSGTL